MYPYIYSVYMYKNYMHTHVKRSSYGLDSITASYYIVEWILKSPYTCSIEIIKRLDTSLKDTSQTVSNYYFVHVYIIHMQFVLIK